MAIILEIKTITADIPMAFSGMHGFGTISGTIKMEGVGVQATLLLFAKPLIPVARTISDANGRYRFNNLNPDMRFMVISSDPTGQKNAVIADNIAPEVPK
ncbi:carboxypeptidase-like regulatory domain-containing protein (plasmid) [Chromobacterium amazonense]|uniref:carboxypeptidase-like regulatory domain-containing protein n=1 Tax=Chromobacterium amazonense TaxID=1382803 RepID=UPI00237E2A52|nr:carboxypeptidase-like regulatory domain-containing protein [Chromobacterium amazonense]MDE1714950.1 carboxypeptidase-like regulatory domain-containing protein [Chromobacterium amazonense]